MAGLDSGACSVRSRHPRALPENQSRLRCLKQASNSGKRLIHGLLMLRLAFLAIILPMAPAACAQTAAPARPPKPPRISEQRVAELKRLRFGMFICWSFSTFSCKEWTPGVNDVAFFRATGCEPEQWP